MLTRLEYVKSPSTPVLKVRFYTYNDRWYTKNERTSYCIVVREKGGCLVWLCRWVGNFVFKTRNFAFKTRNCVSNTRSERRCPAARVWQCHKPHCSLEFPQKHSLIKSALLTAQGRSSSARHTPGCAETQIPNTAPAAPAKSIMFNAKFHGFNLNKSNIFAHRSPAPQRARHRSMSANPHFSAHKNPSLSAYMYKVILSS